MDLFNNNCDTELISIFDILTMQRCLKQPFKKHNIHEINQNLGS